MFSMLTPTCCRLFLFMSCLFVVSCVASSCALRTEPGPLHDPESLVFMPDYADEIKRFSTVSGLASVKVEVGDELFKGSHALFVQTPDKLRADLLGLFGRPIYMLASNGKTITYFLPGENRYFKSVASVENFYRLTHIPLNGADFVGLLLGRMPSLMDTEFSVRIDDNGGHVVTLNGANNTSQKLHYNRQHQLVAGELWGNDRLLLKVEYSAFTDEGFASFIQIEFPVSQTRAVIEFDEPKVNRKIPPQRFEFSLPEGVTLIDINRT